MSITIHVDTAQGETLNGVLAALGLQAHPIGAAAPTVIESRTVDGAPTGLVVNNPPAAPEAPRRGRPRKAESAAPAATPAANESAGEPAEPFVVSRTDGTTEGEFGSPAEAAMRLIEMAHNAGEAGALDALLAANETTINRLPAGEAARVDAAFKAAYAAATQPQQSAPQASAPAEAAAPTAPPAAQAQTAAPAAGAVAPPAGGYKNVDGSPLTQVTPDKAGATAVIYAIASGAPPALGFVVAKGILDSFGVEKVSAIPDGDPRHGEIARKGAALLGLPMAAAPAQAASSLT